MSKHRHSRREFLGMTGLAAGSLLGRNAFGETQSSDADPRNADLVVLNAKVYTVDERAPKAEAFAVKGGRFVAVGNSSEIKTLARQRNSDVRRKANDGRAWIVSIAIITLGGNILLYEVIVGNPFEVEFVTIASIVDKLTAKAQTTPAGVWIEGYFFDDTKVKDNRQLNVHDLDQVSKDHPVVVHHRGGHTSFYNSKALEIAGVNKNTPNPPGGTFDHDASGELNGRVTDRGASRVRDCRQARNIHCGAKGTARSRRAGLHLKTICPLRPDQCSPRRRRSFSALQQVRARGELLHRVSLRDQRRGAGGDDQPAESAAALEMNGFDRSHVEHTVDGSYSERTMAMSQPYAGGKPAYKGNIPRRRTS